MHFNNLPPEIATTILRLICEERHYRLNKWISRITMLAVCRRWRLLALPMVYKKVSIDHIDRVRTNIDLMTESMAHFPRALNIWVSSSDDDDSIQRLQDVVDRLHKNKAFLSRVFNLHLHVDFNALSEDDDSDEDELIPVDTERLQKVTVCMTSVLPSITSLHCHINIAEPAGLVFETALLRQYSSQLVKVEVNSLALLPEMQFTDTLSNLNIWWYPDSGTLPAINASGLTKLELSGIDSSFDWSIFCKRDATESNGGGGMLNFPALVHMFVDVWYIPEDDDTDDENSNGESESVSVPRNKLNYIIDAPRLRVLKIRLCPFTCSLLAAISKPSAFRILEIFTLSDMRFEHFGFHLTDAAKKFFTKYYDQHSTHGLIDDMKFLSEFQNAKELKYRDVSAYVDNPFDEMNHRVDWPRVTRLTISAPISACAVLSLIGPVLPNLEWLKVENIATEEQRDGTFIVPELCAPPPYLSNPIECKLKTLEFGFGTDKDCQPELYEEFSRYMIGNVKSLTCLAFGIPKQ